MMNVKRLERGWVAHFIGGHNCRFVRNTLLTVGRNKVVVSTVGNYISSSSKKVEEIGYNRYYETMAFLAKKRGEYIEADIPRQVSFKSNWAISFFNDSSDNDANKMHENVVKEMTRRLKAGENIKSTY